MKVIFNKGRYRAARAAKKAKIKPRKNPWMKKALLVNSQLTSADLGLEKDFLVGVRLEKGDPGEKV